MYDVWFAIGTKGKKNQHTAYKVTVKNYRKTSLSLLVFSWNFPVLLVTARTKIKTGANPILKELLYVWLKGSINQMT